MEKNRQIFMDAEEIITSFGASESDPDTKAASALISHAVNFGGDWDIESKCVRAFALGMAFERIGGEK